MACTSRQKKIWSEATVFWNEEVNLKRTCDVKAGQYGFVGNVTATSTTEADAAYEQPVNYFSLAFDKNQTTISGLTATNTQLQQQMQQAKMMCHDIKNCAPPPTYKITFQPHQQIQSQQENRKKTMEAVREMDAATTEVREKETTSAGIEATKETVGIQATQTNNPAEDINSDHGGAISPPDNP